MEYIFHGMYIIYVFLKHQTHELTSFSKRERQQEINQSIITAAI